RLIDLGAGGAGGGGDDAGQHGAGEEGGAVKTHTNEPYKTSRYRPWTATGLPHRTRVKLDRRQGECDETVMCRCCKFGTNCAQIRPNNVELLLRNWQTSFDLFRVISEPIRHLVKAAEGDVAGVAFGGVGQFVSPGEVIGNVHA